MRLISIVVFLFAIQFQICAQTTIDNATDTLAPIAEDSLSVMKRHSPKKAALLSAVLPGAGQVYNKKYWKLPIVYGGLAGLGTWIGINSKNLKGYTNAYKLEIDDDPTTIGEFKGITGQNNLNVKRDDAKRNLDISIIITSFFYALNIVDAAVDAHLYEYSINEDLSVRIQPDFSTYQSLETSRPSVGVNFSLHLR